MNLSRRNRMSRAVVLFMTFLLLAAPAVSAGQNAPSAATVQSSAQKPKPAPPATEQPPGEPAAAPQARQASQLANIRIELTITDQRGATPTAPKTVTMLVADRFNGRIRTSGTVRVGGGYQPITLNVDAQPEILRDSRIRVQVSLEYRAQTAEGTQEDNQPSNLTETFSVIVEDGKPMLVTQSADPASDRKVRVELKATQVK
jgi:glucose/arabinose dehydrogenase